MKIYGIEVDEWAFSVWVCEMAKAGFEPNEAEAAWASLCFEKYHLNPPYAYLHNLKAAKRGKIWGCKRLVRHHPNW